VATGPQLQAQQSQQQSLAQQQQQQQLAPGYFSHMQSYSTLNSRCFDLHAPSALLLIPDTSGPSASSSHLIKKYSIVCPNAPQRMQLTGNVGMVRQVAYYGEQQYVAVATNSGLHVLSSVTNNYVTQVDFKRPLWSCAWSRRNQHQVGATCCRPRAAACPLVAVEDMHLPSASAWMV
jgi:hypothetical protein